MAKIPKYKSSVRAQAGDVATPVSPKAFTDRFKSGKEIAGAVQAFGLKMNEIQTLRETNADTNRIRTGLSELGEQAKTVAYEDRDSIYTSAQELVNSAGEGVSSRGGKEKSMAMANQLHGMFNITTKRTFSIRNKAIYEQDIGKKLTQITIDWGKSNSAIEMNELKTYGSGLARQWGQAMGVSEEVVNGVVKDWQDGLLPSKISSLEDDMLTAPTMDIANAVRDQANILIDKLPDNDERVKARGSLATEFSRKQTIFKHDENKAGLEYMAANSEVIENMSGSELKSLEAQGIGDSDALKHRAASLKGFAKAGNDPLAVIAFQSEFKNITNRKVAGKAAKKVAIFPHFSSTANKYEVLDNLKDMLDRWGQKLEDGVIDNTTFSNMYNNTVAAYTQQGTKLLEKNANVMDVLVKQANLISNQIDSGKVAVDAFVDYMDKYPDGGLDISTEDGRQELLGFVRSRNSGPVSLLPLESQQQIENGDNAMQVFEFDAGDFA